MIIKEQKCVEEIEVEEDIRQLIFEFMKSNVEELADKLNKNLSWERPRGELSHWIELLNRMDVIFEDIIKKYGLEGETAKLVIFSEEDQKIVIACLKFTVMLLDNCADRKIYSSCDRIFNLVFTHTIDVRLHAMHVLAIISEKFIQSNSTKYSAPKIVKNRILQIVKSYPPLVSQKYSIKHLEKDEDFESEEKPVIIGDHYNYIDTLNMKKKNPSRWKQLKFQYYRSQVSLSSSEGHKNSSKVMKKENSMNISDTIAKPLTSEGTFFYTLSEKQIGTSSIKKIFDEASDLIPKNFWFEFGLAVTVSKAFNSKSPESMKLREKLLQIKCFGIAFICCMCSSNFASSRMFESEPYIFMFLVNLILPDNQNKVSEEVKFAVIKALECTSLKRVWGSDILRSLGGNLNHGVLFQFIRYSYNIIQNNDQINEKLFVHFFIMIGNLINTKSLTQRLTSAGILSDLMSFLKLRNKSRWICSAIVHLITLFLTESPELFDDFVFNDGFHLLINAIEYEVNFFLQCSESNEMISTNYRKTLKFRQSNYIRNLMKLVSDLIQSDSGDRLRNLFDSPILNSFNKILLNPKIFGPLILSSTIDSVFYIIHNEPTAFSILNEAKVIDTLLNNYENLFLPSSSLLMSLPEVLSAISLNKEGLLKIIDHKVIGIYFKSFFNVDFAKQLIKSDMSTNLGCSFDELGRHHSSLKPIILEETKNLIENIVDYVDNLFDGTKIFDIEQGIFYKNQNDLDIDDNKTPIETWEKSNVSYILDNVFFFLGGLLQDIGQWSSEVMKTIKFELWMSFLTMSNTPYDYITSNGISTLMGIFKYLNDEDKDYGLPVLFEEFEKYIELPIIQEFINTSDTNTCFLQQYQNNYETATFFVKSLSKLATILFTLTEIYITPGVMFQERYQQLIDLFGKSGFKLINYLGLFLQRCIIEDCILRSNTPADISKYIVSIYNIENQYPLIQIYTHDPADKQIIPLKLSSKCKNTLQMRFFYYHIQNYITKIFNCIGRVCMHKRQEFLQAESRRDAVKITLEIGRVFHLLLQKQFSNNYYKLSYYFVLFNIVSYVLKQRERNRDFIHTSLAISFFQNNFFDKLSLIIQELWSQLLDLNPEDVEKFKNLKYTTTDKCSIILNSINQALIIFGKAVNSDYIPNLYVSLLFFYKGYDKDHDNKVTSTFLTQIRFIAYYLLKSLIGSESVFFSNSEVKNFSNILPSILTQLISISKSVHLGKKELSDVEFVPLDVRNVYPPIDQVNFLLSLGMTEPQVEILFKHGIDLVDFDVKKWYDLTKLDITFKDWCHYCDFIKSNKEKLELTFLKYRKSSDLKFLRSLDKDNFIDENLKIINYFPDFVEKIADLFFHVHIDYASLLNKTFDYISYLFDVKNKKNKTLSSSVHLLSLLLKSDKEYKKKFVIYDKSIKFIINEFNFNPNFVNEDYFSYIISILEHILIFRDIPPVESSRHKNLCVESVIPYFLTDELKDLVFEQFLKIENIKNPKSAFSITKIFILYAKDHSYGRRISKSKILLDLIYFLKLFSEFKNNDFEFFRTSLVVLLRRCYENDDIVRIHMSIELSNLFNGTFKTKRDLHSCLKETSSLILRSPSIYVDLFSKNSIIDGYDGSDVFHNGKIFISHNKPKIEDYNTDVSNFRSKSNECLDQKFHHENIGIISVLLSELIDAMKTDWLSDSENKSKENNNESNHVKNNLFKNKNFFYLFFLIETITEILGSYKQAKLEFLTFTKKFSSNTKCKPRPKILNFFINQLILTHLFQESSNIEFERRCAISSISKLALLSFISSPVISEKNNADPLKEDLDMSFIRKFFIDILIKNILEVFSSNMSILCKCEKLLDLFDLCGLMISYKFRDSGTSLLNKQAIKYDQYYIAKSLIDKGISSHITNILGQLDLNFPEIDKLIRSALKPLTLLGKIKYDFQNFFEEEYQGEKDEEEIVSDEMDDREEIPDFFRNSTLGMYDVNSESDDEEMNFYDEEGPLEVLMSGDDISELDENSTGLSDLNLDNDNDDTSVYDDNNQDSIEEVGIDENPNNEIVSNSNLNNVEMVDNLSIASHNESIEDSGDQLVLDNSDFYDFSNEDVSEYNEDLDGWIEEIENDELSHDVNDDNESFTRNQGDTSSRRINFESDDTSDENVTDFDSLLEYESVVNNNGNRNRRTFTLNFFSQLDRTSPALATFLNSFLGNGNVFRGSILISESDHFVNNNSSYIPHFERVFENMLHLDQRKNQETSLNELYIKSIRERWNDSVNLFYSKNKDDIIFRVIPSIVNNIQEKSVEIYKKKKEESEKLKKERIEKLRKKEEIKKKEKETRKLENEILNTNDSVTNTQNNVTNSVPNTNVSSGPVIVRIGNREIDINGTGIDPEFFEALPEDMREEVFMQHIRERRANAASSEIDAREIDPDFLNALPEHIRDEILQQEMLTRRYNSISNIRYDNNSEDEGLADSLNETRTSVDEINEQHKSKQKKFKKIFFTSLVDRQGVYSLIRLLFTILKINQREHIYHTLQYICYNKTTRIEIMGLLISILHNLLILRRPLKKFYSHICRKADSQKNSKKNYNLPVGSTIIIVGTQIIEAINYLLEHNNHLKYYFFTENDNPFFSNKKNRTSSKEDKFAINYLLRLLENNVFKEEQIFMDILSRILQKSTRSLYTLRKVNNKEDNNKVFFSSLYIPNKNFQQIIRVLTSNKCSSVTFRRIISTMENLSVLPNIQRIFSHELSTQATSLGQAIINDLNNLTKQLSSSEFDDTTNKSFLKFSDPSASQAKLLRVLTALDYMFESKEKDEKDDHLANVDDIEELTNLYNKLALGTLWDALSDCLRVLESNPNLNNVATTLLPLIESLMVVCKRSKVKELQIKDVLKYEVKKIDFAKEPIEKLFFSFTDEHKKILNQIVRSNSNLMSGPFGMLVRNPRVLEFDNKKNYFDRKLHHEKCEVVKLAITVRRDQVFLDSYRALFFKSKEEFKNSKLEVSFKGESGVDAGGITREWFQVLSRQMFNPDYALFIPVASDKTTFHPNRTSYINPEHLLFCKFVGRIIGKAIYDSCHLDCHFSRAVYKRLLGRPVSLKDMETLDLEYFKSLIWMLENDITDVITENFSIETDDYGEHKIIDLIENGRNIMVSEENKHEYVRKVVEYRLLTSVSEQMDNFLLGFHEIIPKDLIAIFDEQELELLISGLPDINVTDWQNNTVYNNYSPSSSQIQWFWRAVKSFDNEERAKLLQFSTGTSKVPLNGFKELKGANGICKFSIHRDYRSIERLPSSHTCFNQIDLPAYESYETLRGSLLMAITEGHEGFGLA